VDIQQHTPVPQLTVKQHQRRADKARDTICHEHILARLQQQLRAEVGYPQVTNYVSVIRAFEDYDRREFYI
jgi:hypothetical protein